MRVILKGPTPSRNWMKTKDPDVLPITILQFRRKRMKDNIPEFLKQNLSNKKAVPKFFPDNMKQFILDYGAFYEYPNQKSLGGNQLISLWFRYMKNGINEIGNCEYEGCNNKNRIVNDSKTNGFLLSRGCCTKHSVAIAMLEQFGVENAMHLQSSKDKIKATNLERFGVENPMELESIKNKISSTMLEKYETDNIFKNKDFIKSRFKEKYGVHNPSMVKEFQEKKKITSLKNYGVEYPIRTKLIKDKIKKTNLERYGIEFPIMLQDGFKIKEFKWKTGEVSLVQGYEPIVLKELEDKGYTYEEVVTGPNSVPTIPYIFEGEEHLYFPDIFIPKENLVIEVKSDYTLQKEWEKNKAKFSTVKSHGFDFQLQVR